MTNGDRVMAYWLKSRENLDVSDLAQSNGKFNAAASRYYYALRFAAGAYFVKQGLEDIVHKKQPQKVFVRKASEALSRACPDIQVKTWFDKARGLREKGDYKEVDVTENDLQILIEALNEIFEVIEGEINETEGE